MLDESADELRIRRADPAPVVDARRVHPAPLTSDERRYASERGAPRDHFEYCDAGFVASGNPELDVWRLGALCGPSNGLERQHELERSTSGPEQPQRFRFDVQGHSCVRVAVAVGHGREVEVELIRGEQVVANCMLAGAGWCPPRAAVCDWGESPLIVELLVAGAPGAVAAQLWTR